MITIRPIQNDEIPSAKQIILTVGYGIFGWDGSLEDSIRHFENSDEFQDMDNLQSHYFDNEGLFLVALDGPSQVGSAAIRKLTETTAELKRVWLLDAYQGRGIGFQLVKNLFDFARTQGYHFVRLQTSSYQTRAISFYKRLGFLEIPSYNDDLDAISMEIDLDETK
jgi:putative acetyltransferase